MLTHWTQIDSRTFQLPELANEWDSMLEIRLVSSLPGDKLEFAVFRTPHETVNPKSRLCPKNGVESTWLQADLDH